MATVPGVRRSELGEALRACRNAFIGVGIMSCMINLLYLTGSIFMLEIYDRVLPSRSVPTLVGLIILAGGLYIAQGFLDLLRGRILGRIGTSLDEAINARVFDTVVRLPLIVGGRNEGLQPLRDLDNVRSFLGSMGPGAFFDLPWLPFYLAICFAFHWLLGITALVGAIILVTLTLLTEFMSRPPARDAMTLAARRNDLAAASRRNAEVLVAMGMSGRLTRRWGVANEKYLAGNQRTSDVAGGLGATAKVMRMMLQSAVLGVGAYLVINQMATAGIIIAGSILAARALAPVDLAIANWKGFVAARQAGTGSTSCWSRCRRQHPDLAANPLEAAVGRGRQHRPARRSEGHRPRRELRTRGRQRLGRHRAERIGQVIAGARAGRRVAARARKSPARCRGARSVVVRRARPPCRLSAAGRRTVRRHGRAEYLPLRPRRHFRRHHRGRQGGRRPRLIIKMRDGYETQIGEQGTALSAGQAQRVALARALYGEPFLIVLDEPNSNLDTEGDEALTRAVRAARERGAIVVVVAHRPIGIEAVDMLLVLKDGRMQAFGPKDRPCSRRCCSAVAPPNRSRSCPTAGVMPSHEPRP